MATKDGIMAFLTNNYFATPAQLAKACAVQLPAISKSIKSLQAQNLVISEAGFRPAIFRLSSTGARMMDTMVSSGKRTPSAAVQQHACHRNEIAFMLSDKYPGFAWTPKKQLLSYGLRHALGEHAATDKTGCSHLVLLDDYLMASNRIARTWTRRHAPDLDYYSDHTGQRWCDLANNLIIATTSIDQKKRHLKWVEQYNAACKAGEMKLPSIEVMVIKPLWNVF